MNRENIKQYIPKEAIVESCGNSFSFEVAVSQIRAIASDLHNNKNCSLKLITATDERGGRGGFRVWYVFGIPEENAFVIPFIVLNDTEEFPSLTPIIHKASNYERRIQTFFGLTPIGNLDQRPIILHENWPTGIFPLRKDFDGQTRPEEAHGTYQFQKVEGEGIYEIPVGPIHAGIIEPGHFRFSVAGEEIVLLEARLGFVHKGSEKLFEVVEPALGVRLSEKISGDSSFSHSLSFCQALEQLGDIEIPQRGLYLRVIYAELERLANHLGDIGAIMLDTGFSFGGSHGARLREMIMQINERITGSRFLRGVNAIGGVTKDIVDKNTLLVDLANINKDFLEVIGVAEDSTSLLNRLEGTGVLSYEAAKDHGVVGVAARAVGIQSDARIEFPYAVYSDLGFNTIEGEKGGDAEARFHVRIKEVLASFEIIKNALHKLPEGSVGVLGSKNGFKKNALAVGIVEGWRGEIIYFITTDSEGNLSRVFPRDPSFVNWAALGDAGFGNVVPDFPLINKSFNLSYSGNDL